MEKQKSELDYTRLIAFILLIAILVALYLFRGKIFPKTETGETPIVQQEDKIVKYPVGDNSIPKGFPLNVPLFLGAKVIETYNLAYSPSSRMSQAVVVLESDKLIDEVKKYYESELKAPDFISQEKSNVDMEKNKTLVFVTNKNMFVVTMEKLETGTKISLHFINPLGNSEPVNKTPEKS